MKKLKLSYFIILFFFQPCSGQQFPLFTQYREHQALINPAATSNNYLTKDYTLNFGSSIRYQWTAIDGAPKLTLFQGDAMLSQTDSKVSWILGGSFYNYSTDPFSNQAIYLRSALVLGDRITNDWGIAAGFSIGNFQTRVDPNNLQFRNPFDPLQDLGPTNQSIIDGSAGIFGYSQLGQENTDKIYGGISIPQIGYWLDYNNRAENELELPVFYTLGWYHYLSANSYLESSVWLRQFSAISSLDLNLRYQVQNTFWLGAGLGLLDNQHIHLEAGLILQDQLGLSNLIRIGYGYDIISGPFTQFFGSTHELNVSFSLDFKSMQESPFKE